MAMGRSSSAKRPRVMRALAVVATLLAALEAAPALAKLPSLSKLFVIGDSLSDSGNAGLLSGGLFTPPPYAQNRFSNGPVAVEVLWQLFNPGNTSFQPSEIGGTNYAVGGATTGLENNLEPGDIPGPPLNALYAEKGNAWQLGNFNPYSFDPETSLFTVWLFANDVFYHFETGGQSVGTADGTPGSPIALQDVPGLAVDNIISTIDSLSGLGARNLLVVNAPNLGLTPLGLSLGLPQSLALQGLSQSFNAQLAGALNTYATANPELNVMAFALDEAVNEVIQDPASYGFSNVDEACLSALLVACNDPDSYLFWDSVHPSARAHAYLGQRMYDLVAEPSRVPGPVPALGGLAALAWSRRLRQRLRLRDRRPCPRSRLTPEAAEGWPQ